MVEVAAHHLGLLPEPARADAEDEPSARELVQGGNLLGQKQGVALRDQANAGAQLDCVGDGGSPGQRDKRVNDVGV